MDLRDLVYNYKTKHEEGFIQSEIDELLSKFPDFNKDKFDDALMGCTCMYDEEDGFIMYHCDILTAVRCGLENRNIKWYEFD